MSTPNSRLDALVAEAVEIEDDREVIHERKKEVVAKAKAAGYSTKVFNAVVKRKRREREEVLEEDRTLQAYEAELGLEILE